MPQIALCFKIKQIKMVTSEERMYFDRTLAATGKF